MTTCPGRSSVTDTGEFSLVRGDWPFRIQRAVGLIPADGGLGVGRRALVLVLLTWVPIVLWASLTDRALPGHVAEPLLQHFGVHARCLVAIPLFVVAEATFHAASRQIVPYFTSSGLVPPEDNSLFREAVRGAVALRDRSLPWMLIAGLVVGWIVARPIAADVHEVLWATEETAPTVHLGFGGWWFLYVVRPIFTALLLAYLWRIVLLGVLLRRIAALPLSIVPSHPDRMGGLAFLERVPLALSPGVLAISAVLASRWGHDVAFHGVELLALAMPAAMLLVTLAALVLAPLLAFSGPLRRARWQAQLDYGAVVGEHGRRVRRKWILREPVDDREELLSAPELGPVADTVALYEAVERMRAIPIGTQALAGVLVPAVLPLVAVVAIRIPIKDMLLTILKTLL
jgi:hypothetical protein